MHSTPSPVRSFRSRLSWSLSAALLAVALQPGPAASDDAPSTGHRSAGAPAPGPGGNSPRLINPMRLFREWTVRGGLASGATCVNFEDASTGGPNGGDIPISTIPLGATVVEAWLYWSVLSDSAPVDPGVPFLDGVPITPVPLGDVPRSPCFPQTNTGGFRADVTSIVLGNGTFRLTGVPGNGTFNGTITEGATLFVVYCDPNSPLTDIVLWDGVDSIGSGESTFEQTFTGFLADPAATPVATLVVAAGNGQFTGGPDPFLFNGVDLDAVFPQILDGTSCPGGFYDHFSYDVSPWVPSGATSAVVRVDHLNDCYTFAAIALAVTTDPWRLDDCPIAGCGLVAGAVTPRVSCDASPVSSSLFAMLPDCPPGPLETALQATDPITARDSSAISELRPATTANRAVYALVEFDLAGDVDVDACVEVALLDPRGPRRVLKPMGSPYAGPYDVTLPYSGAGVWRIELVESPTCGDPVDGAALSAARLDVWEQTGLPPVEYRVVDAFDVPECDWSPDSACLITPRLCPGIEDFFGEARCAFNTDCTSRTPLRVRCSGLRASFEATGDCSAQICFRNDTGGGFAPVSSSWDFGGQGTSTDFEPCFTFSGSGPFDVTLTATDTEGCTSVYTQSVSPGGSQTPLEPSALDRNPTATPLRVAKIGPDIEFTWEAIVGLGYDLHRGRIGSYYSHGAFGQCGLLLPTTRFTEEAGSWYYLAVTTGCGGLLDSSYGRASNGTERPEAQVASGNPCP